MANKCCLKLKAHLHAHTKSLHARLSPASRLHSRWDLFALRHLRVAWWCPDEGREVLWAKPPSMVSGEVEQWWGGTWRDLGRDGPETARAVRDDLVMVLNEHPFMWPTQRATHKNVTAGGTTVLLRALSSKPRVLMAEGVLSAAEVGGVQSKPLEYTPA